MMGPHDESDNKARENMLQDDTSDNSVPTADVMNERRINSVLEDEVALCEDEKGMYACDKCKYQAKQRSNLMRHYYTMHADLADHLECCGQFYSTKGDFRQHVKTVHKQGYLCKICNRSFSRKALLKRHSYVHNGIREFKCEHCNYATSHKSNLERHFKVHTPLLRKRRCRLSYRLTNDYPKQMVINDSLFNVETDSVTRNKDPICRNIPSTTCRSFNINPIAQTHENAWRTYSATRDKSAHFGPLVSTHQPVDDYHSILKAQLLNRKLFDIVGRRSAFQHDERPAVIQSVSSRQHEPIATTHDFMHSIPQTRKDDSLRLLPKDMPFYAGCDPNCFCSPNAWWVLPMYQGFVSHQDVYSHLLNKSRCRTFSTLRGGETAQCTVRQCCNTNADHVRPPRLIPNPVRPNARKSLYIDLLKMQENVIGSEYTQRRCDKVPQKGRLASQQLAPEVPAKDNQTKCREDEVETTYQRRSESRWNLKPLKKRFKTVSVDAEI